MIGWLIVLPTVPPPSAGESCQKMLVFRFCLKTLLNLFIHGQTTPQWGPHHWKCSCSGGKRTTYTAGRHCTEEVTWGLEMLSNRYKEMRQTHIIMWAYSSENWDRQRQPIELKYYEAKPSLHPTLGDDMQFPIHRVAGIIYHPHVL